LAEVLFGDVNPSAACLLLLNAVGKIIRWSNSYYPAAGTNKVVYKEGVFCRLPRLRKEWYETPVFRLDTASRTRILVTASSPTQGITKGGSPEFWWAEVSFDVTNAGKRAGGRG